MREVVWYAMPYPVPDEIPTQAYASLDLAKDAIQEKFPGKSNNWTKSNAHGEIHLYWRSYHTLLAYIIPLEIQS